MIFFSVCIYPAFYLYSVYELDNCTFCSYMLRVLFYNRRPFLLGRIRAALTSLHLRWPRDSHGGQCCLWGRGIYLLAHSVLSQALTVARGLVYPCDHLSHRSLLVIFRRQMAEERLFLHITGWPSRKRVRRPLPGAAGERLRLPALQALCQMTEEMLSS